VIEIDEMHEEAANRLQIARNHEEGALRYNRYISQLYTLGRASLKDMNDSCLLFQRLNSDLAISAWKLKGRDYAYIDWIYERASDVHDKLKITYESLCESARK
jgi:hypothetical protein